jgi:hypothetical protein
MLKAIETEYNGRLYRSRIEARWAVFFDTLGIEHEYEKEGYDLDGLWYLPDFWLPSLKLWVEIKGDVPTEQELEKASRLTGESKKRTVILWGDIPLPDKDFCPKSEVFCLFINGKVGSIASYAYWCECPLCHSIGFTRPSVSFPPVCLCSFQQPHLAEYDVRPRFDSQRLLGAYKAARMARFEQRQPAVKPPKSRKKQKRVSKPATIPSQLKQKNPEFKPGDRVRHEGLSGYSYGTGVVLASTVEGNTEYVEVQFKSERRRLSMDFAKLEKIQQEQEDMSLPDSPTLTLGAVKEQWDHIKKRCKTKKDGAKVAAMLNGFDIVGIEANEGHPVVIIQAKANFYYHTLSEAYPQAIAEWAMGVELKQPCKLRLIDAKHCLYGQ